MGLKSSNSIVNEVKKLLGLNEETGAVFSIWEKELGRLAKSAVIAGIQKKTLLVEVESSAHFQELNLRRKELIRKINGHFVNKKVINNIKIKIKK